MNKTKILHHFNNLEASTNILLLALEELYIYFLTRSLRYRLAELPKLPHSADFWTSKLPHVTVFGRASELPKLAHATDFWIKTALLLNFSCKGTPTAKKLVIYKCLHLWFVQN